jgi:CRISPR-associated protein Csm4
VTRAVYDIETIGAVHFGERGIGLEAASPTLSSDGFASALIAAAAHAYEGAAELIDAFARLDLRVSGLFPRSESRRFVPRPLAKTVKRLAFVDLASYMQWYGDGQQPPAEEIEQGAEKLACELAGAYRADLVARVSLDRASQNSSLFHMAAFRFAKLAGLYAAVVYRSDAERALFENALNALAVYGIGGKRASGYGGFSWTRAENAEALLALIVTDGTPAMMLSTVLPDEREIDEVAREGTYRVTEVRGWITTPGAVSRRRVPLRALQARSVLPFVPKGKVVDVTPPGFEPHQVVRVATGLGQRIAPSLLRRAGSKGESA